MKIANVIRTLAAGSALYLIMAACAATERLDSAAGDGGGASTSGATSTGGPSSSSGALVDALADAVSNPVKEASAADPDLPPEVSTENCDKVHGVYAYAEHSYPGVSMAELAFVVPLVAATNAPAGYSKAPTALAWVKDGAVAVICGSASAPSITSVTFVRRR